VRAAPNPPRAKLTNARLVTPLWHGDGCTGLSGLYAIINGIRLVLAHKHQCTAADVHTLLVAGLRFMDGRLSPQRCFGGGIRVQLWRSLADAMVEAAILRTGHRMRLERLHVEDPWSKDSAFLTLENAIRRLRVVMLLCRGGQYTVVSGVTAASLLLFDSGGACWIVKRACGVPHACEGARHVIYPASFMTLVI